MDQRTEQRVRDWDSQSLAGGYGALRNLAEADFSGAVVSVGDTWLFMLNGRVVGVFQGTIEDFETADGTVYEAPDPSLPLLFTMLEQGGDQRAKYYTEDTPVSEAHGTLSDAQFTGYIELSENVLSGDYYVVYYGGRSMSCAFVGSSERLLTGDEAFTQADDEVGIYEVRTVDIDVVDIPEPEEPAPGGAASDPESASGQEPTDGTSGPAATEPASDAGSEPASDAGSGPASDAGSELEPATGREPASTSEPAPGTEADARADDRSSERGAGADEGTAGRETTDEPRTRREGTGESRRDADARGSEPRDEQRGGATDEPAGASGGEPDRERADQSGRRERPSDGDAGRASEPAERRQQEPTEKKRQEPTASRREAPDRGDAAERGRSAETPEGRQSPESGQQRRDAADDRAGSSAERQGRGGETAGPTDRGEGPSSREGQRREDARREDRGTGRQQGRSGGTEPRQRSDDGGRAEAGQPDREPEPAPEPGQERGTETSRSTPASAAAPEPERDPEPAPEPGVADRQAAPDRGEAGDARPEPMPAAAFEETERIPSLDPDHTGTDPDEVAAAAGSGGSDSSTSTDAALGAEAVAADSERRSPEAATGGAVRSSESSDPGAEAVDAAVAEGSEAAGELRSKLADREQRIEDLEAKLADLRVQRDGLRDERDALREEVEDLEAEIADLESEIESLRDRLDEGTAGRRRLSEEDALRGTNLFVRYDSKSAGTLEDAHAGEIDAEEVNENLRLEHHTQFDAESVAVDGRPFEEFFADSIYREFVEWVVRTLLYEVRDTGNVKNLKELYDALPKLDRVELLGDVSVEYTEDGETYSENRQFDVVLRDRKGNPLLVADVNDSRSPATQDMMEAVVENASEVKGSHETLSGAMLVTASFFEPGALETADEAAGGGGLMGGSSKASFVKLSRKQGYHLLLVEARDGEFHVNVPEL